MPRDPRTLVRRAGLLGAVLFGLLLAGCDKGDQLGSVERVARAAFNGWDMWETAMVAPYQHPMPLPPPGTVPTSGRIDYDAAARVADQRPPDAAETAYRRYCRHCHGDNGDGRIIVGESLNPAPRDLRSGMVQSRSEAALFGSVANGTPFMIPLAREIDPVEIVLALRHVKTLARAPSHPFYAPKYTQPLE